MAKFKSQQPIAALPSTPTTTEPVKTEEVIKTEDTSIASTILSVDKKAKFGFPVSQAQNYTVADCRALVKTLVCGVCKKVSRNYYQYFCFVKSKFSYLPLKRSKP